MMRICNLLIDKGSAPLLVLTSLLCAAHVQAEEVIQERGELTAEDSSTECAFSGDPCHCDTYTIECAAGDAVTLQLTCQRMEALIRVTCDGVPDREWGGRAYQNDFHYTRRMLIAPVAGTYLIEVQGLGPRALGPYELLVEQTSGEFESVLSTEEAELTSEDELLPRGELCDWYSIEAVEGELVRILLSSEDYTPFLIVECEATGERWESYSSNREESIEFAIVMPATSSLRIASTAGFNETSGSYDMVVQRGTYQEPLGSFEINARSRRLPNDRPQRPRFGTPFNLTNDAGPLTVVQEVEGVRDGALAAPHLADITGDGQVDLLLGSLSGRIIYYENFSQESARFSFREPMLVRQHDGDPLKLKNW